MNTYSPDLKASDFCSGICYEDGSQHPLPTPPTPAQKNQTFLLTYLFTPWNRVLLEKLTGFQLVKKSPPFYGTRRFITALTGVRHHTSA